MFLKYVHDVMFLKYGAKIWIFSIGQKKEKQGFIEFRKPEEGFKDSKI